MYLGFCVYESAMGTAMHSMLYAGIREWLIQSNRETGTSKVKCLVGEAIIYYKSIYQQINW